MVLPKQKGAELDSIGVLMPQINGEKLKELRERRFLSHRELAQLAGLSPTTVLSLEKGQAEPQRRTFRKLAKALGVEPEELVAEGSDG